MGNAKTARNNVFVDFKTGYLFDVADENADTQETEKLDPNEMRFPDTASWKAYLKEKYLGLRYMVKQTSLGTIEIAFQDNSLICSFDVTNCIATFNLSSG